MRSCVRSYEQGSHKYTWPIIIPHGLSCLNLLQRCQKPQEHGKSACHCKCRHRFPVKVLRKQLARLDFCSHWSASPIGETRTIRAQNWRSVSLSILSKSEYCSCSRKKLVIGRGDLPCTSLVRFWQSPIEGWASRSTPTHLAQSCWRIYHLWGCPVSLFWAHLVLASGSLQGARSCMVQFCFVAFTRVRAELARARNSGWHLTGMGNHVIVNQELVPLPRTGASSKTCPGQGTIETLHFLE